MLSQVYLTISNGQQGGCREEMWLIAGARIAITRPQLARYMASSATVSVIPKAGLGTTVYAPSWVLEEEDRKRYIPGGYHPARVGDSYADKRYSITGKLGWGEYSTVWRARDNQAGIDVAIKIMTDEATHAPQLCELEFFNHLCRQNPSHVGYPHVLHLTDSFSIDGPHGRHLCVVMEMALCNLLSIAQQSFDECRIPEFGAKRVIRDVLCALDYVHSECNIIHTDVKITNVVMTAPLEEMPKAGWGAFFPAELYTFPAFPEYNINAPVTITKSIQMVPDLNDPKAWLMHSFKLIDFGVACYADKIDQHFTQDVCPVGLRPPEVALRAGWGKPVDIWSVGCMLYGMLVGKPLFPAWCDLSLLPVYQLQALGEFPASLRNRSPIRSLRDKDAFPKKSLEIWMEEQTGGTLTLTSDCMHFMRRMLTLEPNERASVEELLRHPWLN
ncbi:kinase-like domain-containing protein [Armillaria luteobubalina]|uniref:non-specific serine/threonine protein kinase n=1 Tax=Armillaria luteobubalina TaxID=153913 RepID=A0AA39QAY0_9AGAR|nr:kinase-like domain-containing protein [Armillaria luteobubalina]